MANKKIKKEEAVSEPQTATPQEETVTISKSKMDEIESKLKMLYEVADKGRVFNYENSKTEKQPIKVKLSVFDGKIIVGWRNAKDILVKHPQTGATVGEEQQMEVMLLDNEGKTHTHIFNGYASFSNAKYDNRIECEVVSKSEDYQGRLTFEVVLPDGRKIPLGAQFVN